ncbi:hypothetical protein [Pelagicoccus mobilis]|uniref:Uncharacterized protein n=1 Tax=Pelagicoccus mobilis TaxID=415221 RepID=A0A934S343_9BACT|nr:hypothetical protein [Pelagicoccus mobilis]MBK1879781.1 hypothetical protein [Pelagicoccus mobilis]
MTKKTLLICSALLAAPLGVAFADSAEKTAVKKQPIAETEMYQDAMADLATAFSLPKAIKAVSEESASDFVSSNPLAKTSILNAKPNILLARLKDKVEPGVSERKAQETSNAAVLVSSPEGKAPAHSTIKIKNS